MGKKPAVPMKIGFHRDHDEDELQPGEHIELSLYNDDENVLRFSVVYNSEGQPYAVEVHAEGLRIGNLLAIPRSGNVMWLRIDRSNW